MVFSCFLKLAYSALSRRGIAYSAYLDIHFVWLLFAGICTTTDVDTLLYHMNNARYLRELDFARVDFYERTNLYREVCSQGSGVVQGAATIRYRRFIKPLTIFKITSKVNIFIAYGNRKYDININKQEACVYLSEDYEAAQTDIKTLC